MRGRDRGRWREGRGTRWKLPVLACNTLGSPAWLFCAGFVRVALLALLMPPALPARSFPEIGFLQFKPGHNLETPDCRGRVRAFWNSKSAMPRRAGWARSDPSRASPFCIEIKAFPGLSLLSTFRKVGIALAPLWLGPTNQRAFPNLCPSFAPGTQVVVDPGTGPVRLISNGVIGTSFST